MATYQQPSESEPGVLDALDHLLKTHQKRLADGGVTVQILMAYGKTDEAGTVITPAIKVRGVECAGLCKIVPHKNRVAGMCDALIELDGDTWPGRTTAENLAILDHELTHLEIVTDERGQVFDDGRRPKLKLRAHDYEIGVFDEVAERHKSNSAEVQFFAAMVKKTGQLYFPGMGMPDAVTKGKVQPAANTAPTVH